MSSGQEGLRDADDDEEEEQFPESCKRPLLFGGKAGKKRGRPRQLKHNIMIKTEEIKGSIPDDHPSFIKPIGFDLLTIEFWLKSRQPCLLNRQVYVHWVANVWQRTRADMSTILADMENNSSSSIVRRNSFEELHVALLNSDAHDPQAILYASMNEY
ncbi:hypothetical protein LINPERHAP1_LOCUS31237 [Linum perenne]